VCPLHRRLAREPEDDLRKLSGENYPLIPLYLTESLDLGDDDVFRHLEDNTAHPS